MTDFLIRLGPMRVALLVMAITVAVLIPGPQAELGETGFDIFRGIIVPTLAPIMFMVLMLDVLMSTVHRADTEDDGVRARYGMIIRTHLVTAAILVLASLPFFVDLVTG